MARGREKRRSVGVDTDQAAQQAKLQLNLSTNGLLPSLSWGGSIWKCLDQSVSKVKTKWIQSGCEISFEREIDQLHVEKVESAIALYFSYPTKWVGSTYSV